MDDVTIFYSWQSDHQETNRFINKALTKAIKEIEESGVQKSLILDRDTKGVVGSPHIVDTILGKIDASNIVVADISIIGELNADKKLVNQNVMYELGYSVARHTEDNVVMLFNSDLGRHKDLPFDISHHRTHTFSINKDSSGKKLTKDLVLLLNHHITSILNRDTEDDEQTLPPTQTLIMNVFATMSDEKRIMAVRTMGGYSLVPAGRLDNTLWKQLDGIDTQEVVAELNDLVNKNILTIRYGTKGTPNYEPASEGFRIIRTISKEQ